MWKKLIEFISQAFGLTIKVEQHDKQIEKVTKEIEDLNRNYRDLIIAINRVADRQDAERERILTLVENQLLKFERRLPQEKRNDEKKDQPDYNFNFKPDYHEFRADDAQAFADS